MVRRLRRPPYSASVKVALAHDWLVGLRGGEFVLDRIVRALQAGGTSCPAEITRLYTMFDDGRPITDVIDALPRTVATIGRIPRVSNARRRWLFPLYPRAVGELSARLADDHARDPIELVISTSSAAIKGLRAPPGVPHVCYCHSPARYAWSQTAAYAEGSAMRRAGLAVYAPIFREWDRKTAAHVTSFIANSEHTRREIARCYGREATVIHPPVRTTFFTPDASVPRGSHWLLVSALEPYKRVELAIEASRRADVPLRIAGSGSEEARLRSLAQGALVSFLGRISDDSLRDEYRRARLLLFPQVEDFGIVAVEAQACGTPVVAQRAGGALDSVTEHHTGACFTSPTPDAIAAAAARCSADPRACRTNAERFSEQAFDAAFLSQLRSLRSLRPLR